MSAAEPGKVEVKGAWPCDRKSALEASGIPGAESWPFDREESLRAALTSTHARWENLDAKEKARLKAMYATKESVNSVPIECMLLIANLPNWSVEKRLFVLDQCITVVAVALMDQARRRGCLCEPVMLNWNAYEKQWDQMDNTDKWKEVYASGRSVLSGPIEHVCALAKATEHWPTEKRMFAVDACLCNVADEFADRKAKTIQLLTSARAIVIDGNTLHL